MKRLVATLAMLATLAAQAQPFVPITPPVEATRIDIGNANGSDSTLRVSNADGSRIVLRINEQGDMVLRWGATVDFNGMTLPTAGKRAGYLLILIDGEPYLIPFHHVPSSNGQMSIGQGKEP